MAEIVTDEWVNDGAVLLTTLRPKPFIAMVTPVYR